MPHDMHIAIYVETNYGCFQAFLSTKEPRYRLRCRTNLMETTSVNSKQYYLGMSLLWALYPTLSIYQ